MYYILIFLKVLVLYHRCNRHVLGQTLGEGEGQGGRGAAVHGVAESWTRLKKSSSTVHEIGAR